MSRDATTAALKAGDTVGGFFTLPDVDWEVPGLLRWSEDGAVLELLASHPDWPGSLGGPVYTIHVRIETLNLTLFDAWTQSVAMGDQVKRVMSPTLVIGAWVLQTDLWPDAFYSSAHLSEWRGDTGLRYSRKNPSTPDAVDSPPPERGPLQVEVGWPTRDEFEIAGDKVAFAGRADTSVGHGPNWSVSTWQVLEVTPREPATMDELRRRFAEPLLAFTSFVADRPDGLTQEILVRRDPLQRVAVWRAGAHVEPREWRSTGRGYLFDAADLVDLPATINRWWEVHDSAWPALGVYAESVGHGSTYTPARLITVFSALERYGKARHSTADLKKLRTYSGVEGKVTGATNSRLRVLEASRGYWAHLDEPEPQAGQKQPLDRATLEEELLPCTRVAAALLQACLLRDIGFDVPAVERIMADHYETWPLP